MLYGRRPSVTTPGAVARGVAVRVRDEFGHMGVVECIEDDSGETHNVTVWDFADVPGQVADRSRSESDATPAMDVNTSTDVIGSLLQSNLPRKMQEYMRRRQAQVEDVRRAHVLNLVNGDDGYGDDDDDDDDDDSFHVLPRATRRKESEA